MIEAKVIVPSQVLLMSDSDMFRQAVGSESVVYHCDVSALKISTTSEKLLIQNELHSPQEALTVGLRAYLAVGMGGIVCFHFFDCSSSVYTAKEVG